MPFDQLQPRAGASVVLTPRYVRYTGHPPPLAQIANQVRTATGYTVGAVTPDGARLFQSLAAHHQTGRMRLAAAEREADALEIEQERNQRDCMDVVAWLHAAERDPDTHTQKRGVRCIPVLAKVAAEISVTWTMARLMGALQRLEEAGALQLVTEAKGRRGAAIRFAGIGPAASPVTFVTVGFTEDVTFT